MNRQVVFALFILVLDLGYLVQALELPLPFERGEPGPSFLPLILVALLAIGALGVMIEALRGGLDGEEREADFAMRSVALIVLTGGFIAAFELLGYWGATVLYTFAVGWLFEQERIGPVKALGTSALIAAGVTGVGWLFFVQLFDLFLPQGMF
ncbi:tripartite tricarboxylate transporter TctB family protein [Lutimaribacter marinistellae]|uniref:Tripartite tricarboxylate transporter TctB family protein n=1 Tax=Lutimaribacter marinistellae TaxID=1820329 RepID=A0ABV7TCB0_9RHOB